MKLQYIVSDQTNPFLNIAVESHLVASTAADTVVLYLWRNRRTVVIGQNQNPYSEVNMEALQADGGYLMRRRTGGGAVYHDDGNLNFSFVAPPTLYDQQRQFGVMQRAVESYGLHTAVSGRNDVLVEVSDPAAGGAAGMRKFSGNAFSHGRTNYLHHGTILIQTHMDDLQRYLRPKPAKLLKHGVQSVQSRVANLGELCPAITADSLQPRLIEAFQQVYGCEAERLDFQQIALLPSVTALCDEFASDEWRLARWQSFTAQRSAQFEWGGVDISMQVEDNIITHVMVASDALDLHLVEAIEQTLTGAHADRRPATDNAQVADVLTLIYG